jgi:hypothetical protein
MTSNHQLKPKNKGKPKYKRMIDKIKLIKEVKRNNHIVCPLLISKSIKLIKQNIPKKLKPNPKSPLSKLYDGLTVTGIKLLSIIKRMNDPIRE